MQLHIAGAVRDSYQIETKIPFWIEAGWYQRRISRATRLIRLRAPACVCMRQTSFAFVKVRSRALVFVCLHWCALAFIAFRCACMQRLGDAGVVATARGKLGDPGFGTHKEKGEDRNRNCMRKQEENWTPTFLGTHGSEVMESNGEVMDTQGLLKFSLRSFDGFGSPARNRRALFNKVTLENSESSTRTSPKR